MKNISLLFVCISISLLFPYFSDQFYIQFVSKIFIMAIFASGLNLLVGYTGLVSLGHAAFFGFAGYIFALLSVKYGIDSFVINMASVLILTGMLGLMIGVLVVRTRGVYFIMVTLAFSQMLFYIFHDSDWTGGSDGLFVQNLAPIVIFEEIIFDFTEPVQFYFLTFGMLCLVLTLIDRLVNSLFGKVICAIKINESRAQSLGFPVNIYKLLCFVISSVIAGVAGFLSAIQYGIVNPEMLSWHLSGHALLMVLLGGMGTLLGPVLGAAIMLTLELLAQSITNNWQLIVGTVIILVALLMPKGVVGVAQNQLNKSWPPK